MKASLTGYRYIYLGSRNSAHYSYISKFSCNQISIYQYNRSIISIPLIFLDLCCKKRSETIITSSAFVVVAAKLFLRSVIFDCHGFSKGLLLLKYCKPSFCLANSLGTKKLLLKLGVKSTAVEPSQKFDSQFYFSLPYWDERLERLKRNYSQYTHILIAGAISDNCDLTKISKMLVGAGVSTKIVFHCFSRRDLNIENPEESHCVLYNYGYQQYEEIKVISSICEFGLIYYANHHQNVFMSPLKGELYSSLGLKVLAPSWIPALKRLSYADEISYFDENYQLLKSVWVPKVRSRRLDEPCGRYTI